MFAVMMDSVSHRTKMHVGFVKDQKNKNCLMKINNS